MSTRSMADEVLCLRQRVATLTAALEHIRDFEPQLVDHALEVSKTPIAYVRCICGHPGDDTTCPVDHDQIQHERET